jgi:hypothetical protein
MFHRLCPPIIDNSYRGAKGALWILGLVLALKATQSLMIIFNGHRTAIDADGIPLDTYPAAAAQTMLALFAQGSLWRLLFCTVGVVILVRYRGAVSLIFAMFLLQYLASQLLLWLVPVVHVGTPPGPIVNLIIAALMLAGLVLSLRRAGSGGDT